MIDFLIKYVSIVNRRTALRKLTQRLSKGEN
jgi:hypothetical protein